MTTDRRRLTKPKPRKHASTSTHQQQKLASPSSSPSESRKNSSTAGERLPLPLRDPHALPEEQQPHRLHAPSQQQQSDQDIPHPHQHQQQPLSHLRQQHHHPGSASGAGAGSGSRPLSVTQRTSRELIGDNFDADTLLAINAIYTNDAHTTTAPEPTTADHPSAALSTRQQQQASAGALSQTERIAGDHVSESANPAVRLSQILDGAGMDGFTSPNGINPRQRYSDETKESKVLKKKSGFSSLMSSLVGAPRKPTISAPENPVHVTHVGYDQETGEFTVGLDRDCSLCEGREMTGTD